MRSILLISFVATCWVSGAIRSRVQRGSDTGHPDFGSYKLTVALQLTLFKLTFDDFHILVQRYSSVYLLLSTDTDLRIHF